MKTTHRRSFLTSLGAFPFLPGLLSAQIRPGGEAPRALILLWMDGGMSHLDTLDCKPTLHQTFEATSAPSNPVSTAWFRQRTLAAPWSHHEGVQPGSQRHQSGRKPRPRIALHADRPTALTDPHLPLAWLRPWKMSALKTSNPIPPYVVIPDAHQFARHGFLPVVHAPFELRSDPSKPSFRVVNLEPAPGMQRALQLLEKVDKLDGSPRSQSEAARDQFLAQARYLSLSPDVRALFNLKTEPPDLRQRYGRHFFGQSCLLARRLVEGGVRTVMVRYQGWDHHQGIKRALSEGFPPKLPASIAPFPPSIRTSSAAAC